MPYVSVIIPVYNGARYIAQAVNSVLRQTYRDMEIIVVDDGSTDDTPRILASYRRHRMVRCLSQDNGGPAKARNTGIKAARGRYIAFLDADDLWLPEKLELQMDMLRRDPELQVVHTDLEVVDVQGRVLQGALYPSPVHEGWIFADLLLVRCWMQLSTLLVAARVLERVGLFNESLPTAEDTNLFMRIAREHRVGFVGRILVQRRLHGLNMTEAGGVPSGTFKNLDDLAERFPELRQSALLKRAYGVRYHLLGCTAFRNGDCADARQHFRKALAYRPLYRKALAYYVASCLPRQMREALKRTKRRLGAGVHQASRCLGRTS